MSQNENSMEKNQSQVTSDQTIKEIFEIAKVDRERAVNDYEEMKQTIKNLPMDKINSMYFQALNQAQQLVQTATDKLVEIAKVLNKKETTKTLNQMNFDFSSSSLLEDKAEDFSSKAKKLGVAKSG